MSLRAQVRSFAALLGGAVAITFQALGPSVPEEVVTGWLAVYMAAFGIGEAFYDSRKRDTNGAG